MWWGVGANNQWDNIHGNQNWFQTEEEQNTYMDFALNGGKSEFEKMQQYFDATTSGLMEMGQGFMTGLETGGLYLSVEGTGVRWLMLQSADTSGPQVVTPEQAKEEFGIDIDSPISMREAYTRKMLKDDYDKQLEEWAESAISLDKPLTTAATWAGTAAALWAMPSTRLASWGLRKSIVAGGTAIANAAMMKSAAKLGGEINKLSKTTKAIATLSAPINSFTKWADKLNPIVKNAGATMAIEGTANALEALGAQAIEKQIGNEYDITGELALGYAAPAVLGAMARAAKGAGTLDEFEQFSKAIDQKLMDKVTGKGLEAHVVRPKDVQKLAPTIEGGEYRLGWEGSPHIPKPTAKEIEDVAFVESMMAGPPQPPKQLKSRLAQKIQADLNLDKDMGDAEVFAMMRGEIAAEAQDLDAILRGGRAAGAIEGDIAGLTRQMQEVDLELRTAPVSKRRELNERWDKLNKERMDYFEDYERALEPGKKLEAGKLRKKYTDLTIKKNKELDTLSEIDTKIKAITKKGDKMTYGDKAELDKLHKQAGDHNRKWDDLLEQQKNVGKKELPAASRDAIRDMVDSPEFQLELDKLDALATLEDVYGAGVVNELTELKVNMTKSGFETDIEDLHPWMRSPAAVKQHIKEVGTDKASEELFNKTIKELDDFLAEFQTPEPSLKLIKEVQEKPPAPEPVKVFKEQAKEAAVLEEVNLTTNSPLQETADKLTFKDPKTGKVLEFPKSKIKKLKAGDTESLDATTKSADKQLDEELDDLLGRDQGDQVMVQDADGEVFKVSEEFADEMAEYSKEFDNFPELKRIDKVGFQEGLSKMTDDVEQAFADFEKCIKGGGGA